MHKLVLAAVALGGLTALTASGAVAAPFGSGDRAAPTHPQVTHADYYNNHHQWHHRRWEHDHWRYGD